MTLDDDTAPHSRPGRKGLLICVLAFAVLALQACIPDPFRFRPVRLAAVHDHHGHSHDKRKRRRDAIYAMPVLRSVRTGLDLHQRRI